MACNEKNKKKADFGIVTFFASNNFGAVLQSYSLQKKISDLGYLAEIINYKDSSKNKAGSAKGSAKGYLRTLKGIGFSFKKYFKARNLHTLSGKRFTEFRQKCMCIGRDNIYDAEDLALIENKYKAFIAGSDMVWTEKGQNLAVFFLRFTERKKRLSYAASLTGTEWLDEKQRKLMGEYISGIEWISCREQEGVDFARQNGRDAFLALDPTLLVTKEEWTQNLSLTKSKDKYLLCYCFGDTTKEFIKKVNKIAKKRGLKVRYISTSTLKYMEELKNGNRLAYGPREFVEAFFNASFIITNTFHGLIFSLIGEKPFAFLHREEGNKWKKNEERMMNMLRLVREEKRAVGGPDEIDDSFFDMDYKYANEILGVKRQESLAYLENMLESAYKNENSGVGKSGYRTISDVPAKLCTGCSACEGICPYGAVEMKADAEGFLRPEIDSQKCKDCGLCTRVCPGVNETVQRVFPQNAFLAFSTDKLSKNSASGGAFITFAKYVIEQLNGTVYGCAMEEGTLNCAHGRAEHIEELYPMQNSKYVQSDVTGCYKQVKNDLQQERYVLFGGTPCQIAGLRSYLGEEYEKLIALDIICHGVPSPGLWRKKVDYMKERYGEELTYFTFRNKDDEAKHRSAYEATVICGNKRIKCSAGEDGYFKAFLTGKTYRMSCYYCKYADIYRCGDITLGDCDSWRSYPEFYPEKTKSSVFINTQKGFGFWEKTKELFVFESLDIEGERSVNKQLSAPTPMPDCRQRIYSEAAAMSWEDFEKKYSVNVSKLKTGIAKIIYKVTH